MTGYLVASFALLLAAAVAAAGVQSVRLAGVRSELASTVVERDVARAAAVREARARVVQIAALAEERRKAVVSEQRVADLKVRIAHRAGTDADAPTAPVLRGTILSLGDAN